MKKKFSSTKGITLIGLIITLVVMVILIGIVVNGVKGDEKVISKTRFAKNIYTLSQIKEKVELYEIKHSADDFDVTDMIADRSITIDEAKTYYDNEGSIESNKIIAIKTAEELAKIGVDSEYPLDGYYVLENDIDLSSICSESKGTWTPIANYNVNTNNIFTGVFNGNNHKIKGLYINTEDTRQALFGVSSGTIKNIKMTNGEITGKDIIASVVAINWGKVINCSNEIPINVKKGKYAVGGIVAYSQKEKNYVKNCVNLADIVSEDVDSGWIGGIIGSSDENTIVENCYNAGNINCGYAVAGIAGGSASNKIKHCYNTGDLTGNYTIIGIARNVEEISYCYNTGKIVCKKNIPGTAGICRNAHIITYCYNTGDVEGYQNVAGIISSGSSGSAYSRIENCYNTGNIKANNSTSAGIVAWLGSINYDGNAEIKNCYNTGDVMSAVANCGGIVGGISQDQFNVAISNCYNVGNITVGKQNPGGILGATTDNHDDEFIEKQNLKNNFYLAGTATGGIYGKDWETKAEAREEEAFKQDKDVETSVTYLLNEGNGENSRVWLRDDSINNGLPYLQEIEPK